MRLTVYTDYSLRLLIFAALNPDRLINISEVAQAYGISRNHLTKVVHQLGIAGYLETVRGKGGGLRLARPSHAIRVGDVVRHTEPDMAITPCFRPLDAPCVILPACLLKTVLHDARDAFLRVLDGYTLADLAGATPSLLLLLGKAGGENAKALPWPAGGKPVAVTPVAGIPVAAQGGAECVLPDRV
jgi:Rrf2 family nitric oxide-sensitive transcriptional repressor